jgi:tetratricopeptide (TPR) repeat protein
MSSPLRTKALILSIGICLGVFTWQVCFAGAQAQAQKGAVPPAQKEEIPPDSNYMYSKDAAALEEIKAKETDPLRRADVLLAWVRAKDPRAIRAIALAASYYGEVVSGVLKTDPQKALAMIQAFHTAAPANTTLIPLEMSANYQAKNYAKAAEIGEKLYAEKPSTEMANTLYALYSAMNNPDKLLVYGEKLVADVPIEKSYGVALQVAQIQAQKGNTEKALQYFSKVMDVYGDKVPTGVREGDWNSARAVAFSALARDSYAKKDFARAIELYDKVTSFSPMDEVAWFYIGMAKWQTKDQKGAIEPFAKAYVIGKSLTSKAKDNMEQLYKAEHNDSLDGLDAVIAKAKSDLGIR